MAYTILTLPPLPSNHCLLLTEKEEQVQIFLKRKIPFMSLFKPWLLGAIIGSLLGVGALLMYQYESDFAVLSVPFWIISLALFIVYINQLTEKQVLTFTQNQVQIHKKRWIASSKLNLSRQDNYDISLLADKKEVEDINQHVPVVFFRMEAFSLFEYASLEEKKWIVAVLQDFRQTSP